MTLKSLCTVTRDKNCHVCDLSPTFSLAALGTYVIKLRLRLCIRRAQDPTLEIQAGFSSKNHMKGGFGSCDVAIPFVA